MAKTPKAPIHIPSSIETKEHIPPSVVENLFKKEYSRPADQDEALTKFYKDLSGPTAFVSLGQPGKDKQAGAESSRLIDYERALLESKSKDGKSLDDFVQLNNLGHDIFITVNEVDGSISERHMQPFGHANRTAKHITRIRAVWADDDAPRNEPREDWELVPSYIVRTSVSGQGNKYHYYWMTDSFELSLFTRIQKSIIRTYGTDRSIHDLARIMRAPGFYNHRQGKKNLDTEYTPIVGGSLQSYSWAEVLKAFPPGSELIRDKVAGLDPDLGTDAFNEWALVDQIMSAESITAPTNSLIMHWAYHYSAAKITTKLNQLWSRVPPDLSIEHADRYQACKIQWDKFINSARATVEASRAVKVVAKKTAELAPRKLIAEDLEWSSELIKRSEIPESAVPEALLNICREGAKCANIGYEPFVIAGMSTVAALISNNVLIQESDTHIGLKKACSTGVILAMETGTRKSFIYDMMVEPLEQYAKRLSHDYELNESKYKVQRSLAARRIKAIENAQNAKLAKLNDREAMEEATKLIKLEEELKTIPERCPKIKTNNTTPEALSRSMKRYDQRYSIFAEEGRQQIAIMFGLYTNKGQAACGPFLNFLSGGTDDEDRMGRDPTLGDTRGCLNMLLFVQPDVAMDMLKSPEYVDPGMAARMPVYFYPVTAKEILQRGFKIPPIDESCVNQYYLKANQLSINRAQNPLKVRLNAAGETAREAAVARLLENLNTKWKYQGKRVNKFVTSVLKYATCIAALDDPDFTQAYLYLGPKEDSPDYFLRPCYIAMATDYLESLYNQSLQSEEIITTYNMPAHADYFIKRLERLYDQHDGLTEGFVLDGDFKNSFKGEVRNGDILKDVAAFCLKRGWLYGTIWDKETRELNGGVFNKKVSPGTLVYHLNLTAIYAYRRDLTRYNDLTPALDTEA